MTIRHRQGFSLVELLIAMVVMAMVLAGTMNFFMGQSRTFRKATTDMVLLQNARFATDLLHEHIRSVGANLTVGQPSVIYADQGTFAFNADYATKTAGDIDAIYYEPNAPLSETQSLTKAQAITIPNTALTYPQADYQTAAGVPSPAEAIIFSFVPDTETTRTDDYVLLRQVNASAPEVVVRNVLADSTYPFFRYMYLKTDPSGNQSIDTVAASSLPLSYDKDDIVAKDQLRGVMISFIVTNGLADTAERTRPVSVVVSLPNVGMRALQTCGAAPLPVSAPTAVWDGVAKTITVTWGASPDETGGERDVMRYSVTRKSLLDPVWQNVASIPAGGATPYTYVDSDLQNGTTYWYAVAAQDCTPAFSSSVSSNGQPTP